MLQFVPRQLPSNIVVIGGGGTGSRLVPLLAQFLKTITVGENPRGFLVNPTIYLVDDDVVEEKNLLRQNFIQPDVGKSKAVVLATRYSRAYGVNIVPVTHRLRNEHAPSGSPLREVHNLGSNALVVMCVDTAQARRDILAYFSGRVERMSGCAPENTPFVIDAGNEDDFGQVRFFNLVRLSSVVIPPMPVMTPEIGEINYLPMDLKFYQELRDNPGRSCADMDQTLAINALMATMIMGVVQNFYYVKPFRHYSMGVSLKGDASTDKISLDYLNRVGQDTKYLSNMMYLNSMMYSSLDERILMYRLSNIDKLKQMGINPDGTLISPPKPEVVKKTAPKKPLVKKEDVVEVVPELTPVRSRSRRPAAAQGASAPGAGLLSPLAPDGGRWPFEPRDREQAVEEAAEMVAEWVVEDNLDV